VKVEKQVRQKRGTTVRDREEKNTDRKEGVEELRLEGTMAKSVSRRDFLKIAGVSGATIGMGAGLGGLVAACGGETTTTTAAPATTTTAGPTTTMAASTTTVSTMAEGRPVKIGVTAPKTGMFAEFARPMDYLVTRATEGVQGGVVLGDGMKHQIEFILRDTQSDSNRAAQIAADLINNDKVDMILSSGSPENVLPVADQCEALGTPSLSVYSPWQSFIFGRGITMADSFKWTYLHAMGIGDFMRADLNSIGLLPTNKIVGMLYPNNANGQSFANAETGAPPLLKAAGYTVVLPDVYPPGLEDFTAQISLFKKEGCEVCMGTPAPSELANFWKQSLQQGFNPKVMVGGISLLFPAAITAIGATLTNACEELNWHKGWPYTSSFTGETCVELADDYEARTGQQWTQALGIYQKFEWAVDVFKRTTNVDDKETILAAITTTKMDTIQGPIDATAPIDPSGKQGALHPHANVYLTPVTSGQWQTGKGKWPFDLEQIGNVNWPNLPNTADILEMNYV
jgi:branched-chain amino acid transport system substrate-binding protein